MKRTGLLFIVAATVLMAGTIKTSEPAKEFIILFGPSEVGTFRSPDREVTLVRRGADERNGDSGKTEGNAGALLVHEPETEIIPDAGGNPDDTGQPAEALEYLGTWTVTAYCPCSECCGEWATGCTASGVMATAGHTVACNVLPIGSMVMIDGWVYTVEDTGWSPYDEWIDIYFDSHEEALQFGIREMEVYLVQ